VRSNKPILSVDFDGVLHSYKSGWKGPRNIPDQPVPGALQFLVVAISEFDVCIYSSRSRYFGGRRAMKRWLRKQYEEMCKNQDTADPIIYAHATESAFADPWEDEIRYASLRFVKSMRFPLMKPPAFVQIDDRAITFKGTFPTNQQLLNFKPWNKSNV